MQEYIYLPRRHSTTESQSSLFTSRQPSGAPEPLEKCRNSILRCILLPSFCIVTVLYSIMQVYAIVFNGIG